MPDDERNNLNVVVYWHMHQPEYRDLRNQKFYQPWTYLHTIKDYVDMAAHIEQNPDAKAVVNFAPVLLEQIEDYANQLDDWLNRGAALRDPLLSSLAEPVLTSDTDFRMKIIRACLKANQERLIDPFPAFKTLTRLAEDLVKKPEQIVYYSNQFFSDLLVWYHLVWTGETVRISDDRIKYLMTKQRHYTVHDRLELITVIYEVISSIIPRYRALAENGQVELSMTPYAHPIVPLLIDLESAKEAMPEAPMPEANAYPGGEERSLWHMQKGIEVFKRFFGFEPSGCWPSEGSISDKTVELISQAGIKWLASGETVLRNSIESSNLSDIHCIHQPYKLNKNNITCFFRDDGLSDLIGFKYSTWHADDAVANLVHHLESIAEGCKETENGLVSIILDGENAWEYYPHNGYYFLNALYKQLAKSEIINLTTYSEYLSQEPTCLTLKHIVAGSWVYGTFSTWIGEKDKNRAWDMLVEAKQVYDRVMAEGKLSQEGIRQAKMQLATCESSDWFWWFGEYNSAESVTAFDEQYRLHLANLYQLLKVEPPEYLSSAFSFGGGAPAMGGAMLPGKMQ